MESGVATTVAMLPSTPPSLMSPLIGSPTLIPAILSPTLSGVQDTTLFQGLTSFETSLNMPSASPHHHSSQHHRHASTGKYHYNYYNNNNDGYDIDMFCDVLRVYGNYYYYHYY
jgi:hypothetical protein